MANVDARETLRQVLAISAGANWRTDKIRLRRDLVELLTDDPFEGEYELVNAPGDLGFSTEVPLDTDRVEIVLQGFGLPDKAILIRGPDGKWRLKSFLGQCTGCLGSGKILDHMCTSCSGTGWGLRPVGYRSDETPKPNATGGSSH